MITDELREWARDNTVQGEVFATYPVQHPVHGTLESLLAIADRIDAEHQKALDEWKAEHGQMWLKGYSECHAELMEGNETLASDLEKAGWVRGPLDADGEMWHSGDMSDSNWGVIEDIAYEDGRWLVSGHDTSAPWVPADSIRHYHPPTVEDVLREFAEGIQGQNHDFTELVIAEYAAKLCLKEDK